MERMKRRYWLMKSEPTCYGLDNLISEPNQTTCWDGVRNYQARNLLRDEIKPGDGVLFYHSNVKYPAIVGLAEVVREGYPDHTALDPKGDHFDPRANVENPIWFMVDIQYRASLPEPLTRTFLQTHPVLRSMDVLKRGNRLSVQHVRQNCWDEILRIAGLSDPLED